METGPSRVILGWQVWPQGIGPMAITRVKLENFTVFESLDLEPSPGINVLVGANGTGKTHLMKVCYAACDVSKTMEEFNRKLANVFLPSNRNYSRLARHHQMDTTARVSIFRESLELEHAFYGPRGDSSSGGGVLRHHHWFDTKIESVYIPAKDMLGNAPGFLSLYEAREIAFEEVYKDILVKAYLPPLRYPAGFVPADVTERLETELGGKVILHGEEFFLNGEQGEIEFTLLAEGLRKLGLLWLLIRNGTLRPGAVLFWDEPETNLNPKLYGVVIEVLLKLQRLGVQVFLATHDYVILKELDLQAKEGDKVAFHSLYRSEETGEIACQTSRAYSGIHPNAIADTFSTIYDREIRRSLAGLV